MKPTQKEYEARERRKCRAKKTHQTWLAAFKFAGALWWMQKKSSGRINVRGAENFILPAK